MIWNVVAERIAPALVTIVRRSTALIVLAPTMLTAQRDSTSRSTVAGTVVDENDRPLAGVVVAVASVHRTAATNDSGRFNFRDLPPTSLVFEVRRVGYRSEVRRLDLAPGAVHTLTVRITRAAVTVNEVRVTGIVTANERRGAHDVSALTEAQLRASATASIGKSLERLPGVSNMTGGPAAGNPVLRGLSQGRVRVVRDGVPQESFEASPRWFPPGNLASVDRIEVIRGPASILYGSNALGGAINIVPRSPPRSDDAGANVSGLLEAQYFSNNDERYGHGEIATARGGVGFRAGGARRVAGNFRTPRVTPYQVSGIQGAPKVTGRIAYTNYEQSSAYAQAGIAGGWGQLRLAYDGWDGANNFANASGKPVGVRSRNDDVRLQGNIAAGAAIVRPSVVVQRVGIRRAATIAKTFEVAADSNLWDQDLASRVFTARVEIEHQPIGDLHGTVGAEWSARNETTRRSQIQPSGAIDNAAVFAFEQLRFERLTLSSGARLDMRRQHAAPNTRVDEQPAATRATALDRRFSVASGSLGVSYQITAPLSVATNATTGFRAPSFVDLYTNEYRPALSGWVEGNPLARAERAASVEAGIHYVAARLAWSAIAYRNAFTDFTYLARSTRTRVVSGAAVPVFATDQARGRLTGVEISTTAEIVPAVVLDASYSKIASRNLATREQLPLMPADQARMSLRATPSRIGRVEVPYVQIGAKHAWRKSIAGPTEPFADGGAQGFGVASTPAYTLVDAGVGGTLRVGASAIEAHVSVENLFGVAYRDFLDTQKGFTLGPGRNIGLRMAAPFVLLR